MSRSKAKELGVEPLAEVSSCSLVGGDPSRAYETVPKAAFKALNTAGVHLQDIELIEIQEAFAAQVLADLRQMEVGPDHYHKINVNGSGISLGHPIGCTGTRVLVSLVHEMRRRGTGLAMEAICGGGGLGIAAILKQE
jgi:acetyl-CoA C-acetyltransferase